MKLMIQLRGKLDFWYQSFRSLNLFTRNNAADEKVHLRSRIAELEGVIREVK